MRKNILVVVDVQNDFCKNGALEVQNADSIIKPLNEAIMKAESSGFDIIYTRDWHPDNHMSFKEYGGPWPTHCVKESAGAKFHKDLFFPERYKIIDKGILPHKNGYSPFENSEMGGIINNENVNDVYVTGIALEYCVMSTCLDLVKYKKNIFAVEPLIRSIAGESNIIEENWDRITKSGVTRIRKTPLF